MNKIAMVIPYFGKFNNYFHLWKRTALANPSVDFLFYTDLQVEEENNIKVCHITLQEINTRIVKRLSKVLIDNKQNLIEWKNVVSPYKLCDYKPVYGIIFEEDLIGYDFWGHCDIDLVFGNIRHFITDDILNSYDRILSRGHFSLYRNNQKTNQTFLLSKANQVGIPSYEIVYSSDMSFAFDEWPGLSRIWQAMKNDRMYDDIVFDDLSVLKGHFVSYQKKDTDVGVSNVIFEYDNGNLYRHYLKDGKQVREMTMYVHFQKRLMSVEVSNDIHYLIVPNKFINYQEPTILVLQQYGKKQFFYPHAFNIRWQNMLKKVGRKFQKFKLW